MEQKTKLAHSAESILFLVDIDKEMQEIWVEEEGLNRLAHVKQCICTCASFKLRTYPYHRFNLAVFDSSIKFLMNDFTSDLNIFKQNVSQMQASSQHFMHFDLQQIPLACTSLKQQEESAGRFFRVVLVYGRSDVVPIHVSLFSSDALRIDLIYMHKRVQIKPQVQHIFDHLCEFVDAEAEKSSYQCYVFELTNSKFLAENFARIMSHGLQRISQEDFDVHPIKDISKLPYRTSDIDRIPLPEIGLGGIRGAFESAKVAGKNFLSNRQQLGTGNNNNNIGGYNRQQNVGNWEYAGNQGGQSGSNLMDINKTIEVDYGPSTEEFSEWQKSQKKQYRY